MQFQHKHTRFSHSTKAPSKPRSVISGLAQPITILAMLVFSFSLMATGCEQPPRRSNPIFGGSAPSPYNSPAPQTGSGYQAPSGGSSYQGSGSR